MRPRPSARSRRSHGCVVTDYKFCGLTRAADTTVALEEGARYAGVIFAGGPRLVTEAQAREVFAPLRGTDVGRVGVFGAQEPAEVARIAHACRVDVVQLHGGSERTADDVRRMRSSFGGGIWVVARLKPGAEVPWSLADAGLAADALVLDAAVEGQLGGTGIALDWTTIASGVGRLRAQGVHVVLAGGLRAENVARAVRQARPDVVDVSSGVESAPGIKDHARMRAFAQAVHSATDEE
jgi:phosphoribosylanthranilate isomerase